MVNHIEIDFRIYMYWVEIETSDNENLSSDQNNETRFLIHNHTHAIASFVLIWDIALAPHYH